MNVLSLLNAKPKPKPKRQKPKPKPEPLPRFNPIQNWVKFVHPPIGDQAKPERRGPKVVPAACDYATPDLVMDATGCQSRPGVRYVFVEGSGYELAEPAPEPTVERPSKSDYIQAFQHEAWAARKPLPACVLATWFAANDRIVPYMERSATMPRRARRALYQYVLFDLSCAYNTGLIGRIAYYCESHNRRAYASKYLSN